MKNNIESFERYIPYGLFIFFLIIYIAFISEIPSLTHDSITYANEIENDELVFHPHHLLYHALSLYWYKLLLILGIGGTALAKIASLNSLFGAAGISLIYIILRKDMGMNVLNSLLISGIAGFSFGYWFYSINVEVYIIPLIFILMSIHLYNQKSNITLIALFSAVAALFHQIHILFGITLMITFFVRNKYTLRQIAFFSIAYFLVIAIPYILVMSYLNISSFDDISYWLTKYHHEVNSWNDISFSMIVKDLVGFTRSLVSTYGMFRIEIITDALNSFFPDKNFDNEIYLLRNISAFSVISYMIFTVFFYILYVYSLIYTLLKIPKMIKKDEVLIIIITIAVYSIFFSFWDSANVEFWIPQSTLLWLLIGYAFLSKRKYIGMFMLMIVFIINFIWAIIPANNIKNDHYYAIVKSASEFKSKSTVLLKDKWIKEEYFKKYSALETIDIREYREQISDFELNNMIISEKAFPKIDTSGLHFKSKKADEFTWYFIDNKQKSR